MQSAILLVLFAATALAAPAAPIAEAPNNTSTGATAAASTSTAHCGFKEVLECAAGLGPSGITCVLAALQEGLDPIADLPCLGSLIADIASPPEACRICI